MAPDIEAAKMPQKAIHHRHNLPVLRQGKSAISNECVHLTHKVKRIGIDLKDFYGNQGVGPSNHID